MSLKIGGRTIRFDKPENKLYDWFVSVHTKNNRLWNFAPGIRFAIQKTGLLAYIRVRIRGCGYNLRWNSLIARYIALAAKWIRQNDYAISFCICARLFVNFCGSSFEFGYLLNGAERAWRWRWRWQRWSIEFCAPIWKNAHLIAFTLKATTNYVPNKCEWVAKWMWRIIERWAKETQAHKIATNKKKMAN